MLIDENTTILYENYRITIDDIVKFKEKYFDTVFLDFGRASLENLVILDIYEIPVFIQRSAQHGDLVLDVNVIAKEPKYKGDRPYSNLTLTPTQGRITRLVFHEERLSKKEFSDHIEFERLDLTFRIYYSPRNIA